MPFHNLRNYTAIASHSIFRMQSATEIRASFLSRSTTDTYQRADNDYVCNEDNVVRDGETFASNASSHHGVVKWNDARISVDEVADEVYCFGGQQFGNDARISVADCVQKMERDAVSKAEERQGREKG
ncbi:hypothetical protein Fot_01466 [Forsythia ovata]|uniref:Uncharacterized protein n=1 Tax=Forsythia ovata TaxID=205694 RepID=A0ABD1X4K3_9LAMI